MKPKITIERPQFPPNYRPVPIGSWLLLKYPTGDDWVLHLVAQVNGGDANLIVVTESDANRKTTERPYKSYEDIGEECLNALVGKAQWRFADVTINARPL